MPTVAHRPPADSRAARRPSRCAVDIDSALFFNLRSGLVDSDIVRSTINNALATAPLDAATSRRSVFFVGHFRHHWVALHFSVDSHGTRGIEVFDSAPSPMVARDISRLAAAFGWPSPVFVPSPRQTRGSDECGLFAIAAVLLLREGYTLPTGTFVFQPLRELLKQLQTTDTARLRLQFTETARQLLGIKDTHPGVTTNDDSFFCTICRRSFPVADPRQRDNLLRTHALSRMHRTASSALRVSSLAPCAGNEGSAPAPERCAASTQAKHGGRQCAAPAVFNSLCRLHLLLSRSGTEACAALSKAGRPCSHRAVNELTRCPFHVDDSQFEAWVEKLRNQAEVRAAALDVGPETNPPHAPDTPLPAPALVAALTAVNDPDFEDELAALTAPWAYTPTLGAAITPLPHNPTLADLRIFLLQRGHAAHPLASLAWRRATLLGHARSLRLLRDNAPTHDVDTNAKLPSTPLVSALLEIVASRRRQRKWTWSTVLRVLAEIAGALRNLPISQGLPAVDLASNPEWVAAIRGVAGMAKSERPRVPQPASSEQILTAIRSEPRRPVRLLLALTWLCCGRTGDCRLLTTADLALQDRTLTVTFRHGKTISRRGPYSLHTRFPTGWIEELVIQPDDVSWASELKKASVADVLVALRRVSPDLENRSVRRGALQSLARAGTPEDVMLLFSGHTSIQTLRRYLAWGAIGTAKRDTMTAAALALDPAPIGGSAAVRRHDPYGTSSTAPPSYAASIATGGGPERLGYENERWLQFLGAEAPPLDALPCAKPLGNPEDLPLMSKDVAGTIDLQRVLSIVDATTSDPSLRQWAQDIPGELRQFAAESLRWLHDPTKYDELLRGDHSRLLRIRRAACCRLPAPDFEMQQMLRKYERAEFLLESPISAWCRIFAVPEWHKEPPRRRHIAEPLINDLFVDTPTIKFRSRQQRHQIIGRFPGGFAATMDLASYFDQFSLSPAVRQFFGVRFGNRRSRLAILPMGFRPAAQIAQALTWILCSGLEREGIRIITYLDNILVLGRSSSDVNRIRAEIHERARLIGAVFNTDEPATQRFEFLGEAFDLSGSMVSASLSAKTLRKLNLLDENALFTGIPMTKRQLAAVVGLALFAGGSGLRDNSIFMRYDALRFYREQLRFVDGRTAHQWDAPISCPSFTARACFVDWLRELKSNTPRIVSPLDESAAYCPDVLFTDACETGWGAIHCRPDGSIRVFSEKWLPEDYRLNLASSVVSEPLGLARALCRAITPALSHRVVCYTDHQPIVTAVDSVCARTHTYWILQRVLRDFPVRCVVRHVRGARNPADSFSRGVGATSDPAWSALLAEALEWHGREEAAATGNAGVDGEYGENQPEWLATARNPLRRLVSSVVCCYPSDS